MIKVGEIRTGRELGKTPSQAFGLYIYHMCPDCGKKRWISYVNGKPNSLRCNSCSCRILGLSTRGENNPNWKGGRTTDKHSGYIYITLQPDDPFYCMIDANNYVAEHRYVMAQHLGRPLESWEIVHHKGTKYLMDSKDDRSDNRIENLELVTTSENFQIKKLVQHIQVLERSENNY